MLIYDYAPVPEPSTMLLLGSGEKGDVDQKHQIFPPRSSFRIALARADTPTPKCPAKSAIEISISGFKRKVNISIDGFEQRPLLHKMQTK